MNRTPKTALIVDDELSILHVLYQQLRLLGYETVTAPSGQEALDKLADQEFTLVLLDVRMPGMSGLKTLEKLRAWHPQTCVVMLTAVVDTAIAAEAVILGADDYVTKPWSLDDLGARLRKALKRGGRARQHNEEKFPGSETAQVQPDFAEITSDLVNQQVAQFQRVTSRPSNPWFDS